MKNRVVAAFLAFIFGSFGVHKFYLRDPGAGIFYLIIFFITSRFFPVTAILGIIDAIRLLMMTDEEFDRRYNRRTMSGRAYRQQKREYRRRMDETMDSDYPATQKTDHRKIRKRINPFKKSGLKKYREFELEEAIEDFKKGLEIEPSDIALHFNIACAFSLTEHKEKAFYHISKAVEYGFKDFEKIQTHDDLAYMRIQPEYEAFKEARFRINGKQEVKTTNEKEDEPAESEIKDDVLLSQLNKLAELRKKGLLSEDEFVLERKKLLRK